MIKNTAIAGGSINVFNSSVKIISSNNLTTPLIAKNNAATEAGGFIQGSNSNLDIYNNNFINNTARFGGAISIQNSTLKLIGSIDITVPTIYESNVAGYSGGLIYAVENSTVIISQGYLMFRNNMAIEVCSNYFQ